MNDETILSYYLQQLGVPHTVRYSDINFRKMPFQSLFGLQKLLLKYDIPSDGYSVTDKTSLPRLPLPLLAQTSQGFVIVTAADGQSVEYLTDGKPQTASAAAFNDEWTGVVFIAYPQPQSAEPHYEAHHIEEVGNKVKRTIFPWLAAALLTALFIANGLWRHWSLWLVTLFNLAGLYLTYLLVQKSVNIRNKRADAVCGILQKGGCDEILAMKASKFFGLFGWSEVGFAYFSISLLTLLLLPQYTGALALCNMLCLPFTVWSIWYQKFRAHHWCTLCVGVQSTLWLLFFSYLGGGYLSHITLMQWPFWILALAYGTALLALNKLMPLIEKTEPDETPE